MARRSDHSRNELKRLALDAAAKKIQQEGLRGLKARQIARDIGYTIGTLYNIFDDLDDLIVHVNGETLDRLYDECSKVVLVNEPVADLYAYAEQFLTFTQQNPKLWNAVFDHKLPDGRESPEWFVKKVDRLLMLEAGAFVSLFPNEKPELIRHHAQVLWMSLFGMASVENAGRLTENDSALSLVRSLIETYVAGLSHNMKED